MLYQKIKATPAELFDKIKRLQRFIAGMRGSATSSSHHTDRDRITQYVRNILPSPV
jgi:hypothetical protein